MTVCCIRIWSLNHCTVTAALAAASLPPRMAKHEIEQAKRQAMIAAGVAPEDVEDALNPTGALLRTRAPQDAQAGAARHRRRRGTAARRVTVTYFRVVVEGLPLLMGGHVISRQAPGAAEDRAAAARGEYPRRTVTLEPDQVDRDDVLH